MGVSIEYVQQKEQLGTANAIGYARGHVEGAFLVLNGDMLIENLIYNPCLKEKRKLLSA